MKELLLELEKCLIKTKNPITQYMDSIATGFDEIKFINILQKLKLDPTQDLLDLYSWKTGVDPKLLFTSFDFAYKLFSFGSPIAYIETPNLYLLDRNTDRYFANKYLPIIYNNILEDPVLINLSKKSKDFGAVYYYCPSVTLSSSPVIIYDSLSSCIETIIECYQEGAYMINDKGLFENNDKEQEISIRMNKKADYWHW